jgi:TetR/AcrR family transcriptional regulator
MAQDTKQKAIIDAAIRRFAHFGVAKTTMSEIAADLSLSKASLYYYFPDKISLYAAVLKSITHAFAEAHDPELARETDPFKAVLLYLQRRTDFIIQYHNILEYLRTFTPANMPAELQDLFAGIRKKELQRLVSIFGLGVQSGKFQVGDVKKTAELFFDLLEGLRSSHLLKSPNIFPDKKQFLAIHKKETDFADIFLKGLTIKRE